MNKNIFVMLNGAVFLMAVSEEIFNARSFEIETQPDIGERPLRYQPVRRQMYIVALTTERGTCYVAAACRPHGDIDPKLSEFVRDQLTYGNLEYWGRP